MVQENSGNPLSIFLVEIDEERRSQVLQILWNLSNNEEKHQDKSRIASSTSDPRHTMVINSHGLHRSIPNEFGIRLPLGNHLQGDGQAERMIQKVVQILCAMVRPDQCDWAVKLLMAEFAINVSSNTSTGFAPFELIYGHMPKICLTAPPSDYPGVNDFAQKVRDNLMAAHDAIIHNCTAQTIQANKKRCLDLPLKKGKLTY